MYVTSLRTKARNSLSMASSSRTICAAATVSIRANASSALRRMCEAISPETLTSAMLAVRAAPSMAMRRVRFAIFRASSPARSRLVTHFEAAIRKRRSRAAGCRRAMMLLTSSSISISIALSRCSPLMTCSTRAKSNVFSASIARAICDSTSPPISSNLVKRRLRSASNLLEICLSDMFIPRPKRPVT